MICSLIKAASAAHVYGKRHTGVKSGGCNAPALQRAGGSFAEHLRDVLYMSPIEHYSINIADILLLDNTIQSIVNQGDIATSDDRKINDSLACLVQVVWYITTPQFMLLTNYLAVYASGYQTT
jgi:hypothetical protein